MGEALDRRSRAQACAQILQADARRQGGAGGVSQALSAHLQTNAHGGSGAGVRNRLHLALLHGAALLVRAQDRGEWLAEWRAELSYVWPRLRTRFCLGAFRDAFWLRRHSPPPVRLQSPWQCLGVLTALAGASLLFAFRLPLPREVLFPRPLPPDLVTISGIPVDDYRQLPVPAAAFYGPAELRGGNFTVSLASRNLFDLLNVPIPPAAYPLVITL